jgi:signal transduction histidine kinase
MRPRATRRNWRRHLINARNERGPRFESARRISRFAGLSCRSRSREATSRRLTEREGGGDFTDEDEDLTQLLATQAAAAIENARLYESSTRRLRRFESLNEIGNALYRIAQEALTNFVKHAGAARVSVVLVRRDGSVTTVVEDDGRGFDPATARDDALGLAGMRERLALVGGRRRIESGNSRGTTLVAEVPAP